MLADSMRERLDDGRVPVVVRLDSRVILALGRKRTVLEINQFHYHQLKALAHIPLLLFLASYNDVDVHGTRTEVEEAMAELRRDPHLPAPILSVIQAAVTSLFESPQWPSLGYSAVRQYNEALQPAFQALIALAARDEAQHTLKALQQLEAAVDDEQLWKQTFYVVCGGHQPRYKQLAKLVCQRWVWRKTESSAEVEQRVLYGESLESVESARELVATRLVDSVVGDAFLNSPLSMNQDVLGEAGKIAIDEAFSAEAEAPHR